MRRRLSVNIGSLSFIFRKERKMNKRECYGILDDFSKAYGVTIELKEETLTPETELIIRDPGNLWVSRHKLVTHTHAELASILDQVKRKYNLEVKDYIRTYELDLSLYPYFKPNTTNTTKLPEIKDVIFNEPATIIIWKDGTKTVVKCQEGECYDPEKGMAMAISKKALGNKGNYCEVFKKWLPEEEEVNDGRVSANDLRKAIDHFAKVAKKHNIGL